MVEGERGIETPGTKSTHPSVRNARVYVFMFCNAKQILIDRRLGGEGVHQASDVWPQVRRQTVDLISRTHGVRIWEEEVEEESRWSIRQGMRFHSVVLFAVAVVTRDVTREEIRQQLE